MRLLFKGEEFWLPLSLMFFIKNIFLSIMSSLRTEGSIISLLW